jgi:hypothetical protein
MVNSFIVRAGAEEWMGGDPCGRPGLLTLQKLVIDWWQECEGTLAVALGLLTLSEFIRIRGRKSSE